MRHDVANDTYTLYYYDGLTVIAEKEKVGSGSWNWKRIYTVGPGVIGQICRISEWSGSAWTDTYYHYDAIGNVALRTSSSGNVIEAIDQEAYGNVKIGTQTGYHLTTKEYDADASLYYFYYRWYEAKAGIFTRVDPFYKSNIYYEPNSHKYYVYCDNNPVKKIDPDGRVSKAAAKHCLKEAKDKPNMCKGACGTNAEVDCEQAKECLEQLGITYTRSPCGYAICEIGLGEIWGINLCLHSYCCVSCGKDDKYPR